MDSVRRRAAHGIALDSPDLARFPDIYLRHLATELDKIFRLESVRTISDDWVVRYDNRFFQLERQSRHYAPAKGQVVVCEAQDGSLAIEYRGCALCWQEIPPPLRPTSEDARAPRHAGAAPLPRLAKRKWAPPADHPWRWAARRREIEKGSVGRPPAVAAAVVGLACPALRPKRSALRAPQSSAQGNANDLGKTKDKTKDRNQRQNPR